jgi:hypothetical protein
MKNYTYSTEDIVKYWGSLEAFYEEQRQIGAADIELAQREGYLNKNYRPVTSGDTNLTGKKNNSSKPKFGLRLFGHGA